MQIDTWTYRMKNSNGGKLIGNFYVKELLLSYYPEPDSHIRDKVELVLELSNYTTKEELKHATDVDTSN